MIYSLSTLQQAQVCAFIWIIATYIKIRGWGANWQEIRVSDFEKNLILVTQNWQIKECAERKQEFLWSPVHRDRTNRHLPALFLSVNRRLNGTLSPRDITLAELDTSVLENNLAIYARLLTAHAVMLFLSSVRLANSKYRVIQNDCRGFNNLSYTTHLR